MSETVLTLHVLNRQSQHRHLSFLPGCPYCLTMLSDGTKAKEVEDTVGTYDIAEILERAVFGTPEKAQVQQEQEEVAEETVAKTCRSN